MSSVVGHIDVMCEDVKYILIKSSNLPLSCHHGHKAINDHHWTIIVLDVFLSQSASPYITNANTVKLADLKKSLLILANPVPIPVASSS